MDAFLNTKNSKNKNLREWNPRRSGEQDVVWSSPLGFHSFKSLFLKLFAFKKSVHHDDVVGVVVMNWKE